MQEEYKLSFLLPDMYVRGAAVNAGYSACENLTVMLQYSYYDIISPEGCAAILWKNSEKAAEAAHVMGITANRLLEIGLIIALSLFQEYNQSLFIYSRFYISS